jgi:metal-dependent amidase/aminoacylase/carboxypeptidase family protein
VPGDADVLAAVEARRDDALEVMRFVHAHPELGHEEHECSRFVADRLAASGFEVEREAGGMTTAFRALVDGSTPGRTVGIVCLYDAVAAVRPDGRIDAVHSCGHGPIAGGVTAAALALADRRDSLAGRVAVLGCPADEIHAPNTALRGGGKTLSVEAGLWDGVDAALYAHPEFIDTVSLQSRWLQRLSLLVSGNRSLRGELEPPLRAARAVLAANERDIMVEHLELDGDVEEGTGLALRAHVLVFADSDVELEQRTAAVMDRVPGGDWRRGRAVQGVRPDAEVTAAVASAFEAAGRSFVADPPPLPFATDFGNISRRVPAALIGIGRPGGWSFHTDEGAAEFASDAGAEAALTIARVLALAATRLTQVREHNRRRYPIEG